MGVRHYTVQFDGRGSAESAPIVGKCGAEGHEALAEISIAASSIANKLLPIQIACGGAKIRRSLLGCVDNSNILARIP